MRHHRGLDLIIICILLFPGPILHSANQLNIYQLFKIQSSSSTPPTEQLSSYNSVDFHQTNQEVMHPITRIDHSPNPLLSPPSPKRTLIPPETPHNPIVIDGNDNFTTTATNELWPGDGTPGNPYRIENYEINRSWTAGYCISISNTNVSTGSFHKL